MPNKQTDDKVDVMRKKANKRLHLVVWLTLGLFLLVCVGVLGLAYIAHGQIYGNDIVTMFVVGIVCAVAGFGLLYWLLVQGIYSQFNATYKESYVLEILQQNPKFQNIYYSPKAGLPYQTLQRVGIIPMGVQRYFKSEDMLSGSYRNIKFFVSDVVTKKPAYENRIQILFEGQVICLEGFQKRSATNVQVFHKKFPHKKQKGYAIPIQGERWNNIFHVYAEQAQYAQSVLTPKRTEQLITFANAVQTPCAVIFENNRMFLALHTGNSMFDANISQTLSEQKDGIAKGVYGLEKALDIFVDD